MKIAVLGYGTIGKGLVKLAGENNIEVSYILMRDIDELTQDNMTKSIDEIVNDKEVDAVVECIGGDEPAYSYAKKAIEKGHSFISSNKKMIEKHYRELSQMAKENNVSFLFSSACGGGIPWLKELYSVRESDELMGFRGIMNGTSNYILYKMFKENLPFDTALKDAQKLGYAESDPSDDIDGVDTANKTLLSMGIAYRQYMKLEDTFIKGIRHYTDKDMEFVRKQGLKCVLLGNGKRTENGYCAYVIPTLVNSDSIFYSIKENCSCFVLKAKNLGELSLIGQGAGSLPTASNIIRDLKMLSHPYRIDFSGDAASDYKEVSGTFYIRSSHVIEEKYVKERIDEERFITKKMSIDELKNILNEDDFVGEIVC